MAYVVTKSTPQRRLRFAWIGWGTATVMVGTYALASVAESGSISALGTASFALLYLSASITFSLLGYKLGNRIDDLEIASFTDPVTQLPNRRYGLKRLREEVSRSQRYGTPLALLALDLDNLKSINDRSGHSAGDLALRTVAKALRDAGRTSDIVARFGGDEFVVIAPNTASDAARALGERICSSVSKAPDKAGGLTVSVGVAQVEGPDETALSLYRAADSNLYVAKRMGRNRVVASGLNDDHDSFVPPSPPNTGDRYVA